MTGRASTGQVSTGRASTGRASGAPRAWQRMLSGRRLNLLDPSPLDIEIDDIAHGLARVARWNGQTIGDHAFSVAQHGLLVLEIGKRLNPNIARPDQLILLLHDAPEYVIGDMISPFKAVIGEDYKRVERGLMEAIHIRFGLPPEPAAKLKSATKEADRKAAYFEATTLAGFSHQEALKLFGKPNGLTLDHLGSLLDPWPTAVAQQRFLAAFTALDVAHISRQAP